MVFHRPNQKNDALFQQSRIDVVGTLSPRGLFDHDGNQCIAGGHERRFSVDQTFAHRDKFLRFLWSSNSMNLYFIKTQMTNSRAKPAVSQDRPILQAN